MGQVPIKKYGIIGDGRVANHLKRYFTYLSIPYIQWSRKNQTSDELLKLVFEVDVTLLLIKDDALESFIEAHPELHKKQLLHFSGSKVIKNCYGVHPLMTFGTDLYPLEVYKKIPFVIDEDAPDFEVLFPELQNNFYRISKENKVFYHALCVMAGNFSTILWQKLFQEFENKLSLPREVAFPYLEILAKNLMKNAEMSLTGPLIRNDQKVLQSHLDVLKNDRFKIIYEAFMQAYQMEEKS